MISKSYCDVALLQSYGSDEVDAGHEILSPFSFYLGAEDRRSGATDGAFFVDRPYPITSVDAPEI